MRVEEWQFDIARARERKHLIIRVRDRLIRMLPALAADPAGIETVLGKLVDAGFEEERLLWQASETFFRIGLRTDPDAAEARAIAEAILFDREKAAEDRSVFLRAQGLSRPVGPA